MPPEELKRHLHPFTPFRIQLSTGETFDVRHPDLIMVGKRTAIIGFSNDPTPLYDRAVTVALLHIVRLEPLDAAPPAGQQGNGLTGG